MLWATIWAHPRTAAHALSYLPLRHLYRSADAIATYGPHVSAYVRAKGARGPVVEAPQSVDNAFWAAPARPDRRADFQVMFAGRLAGEKGVAVLLRAWSSSGLSAPTAALVLVGGGPIRARAAATGAAVPAGPVEPDALRNFYAGSDVVVIPSIPTRDFLEPWGLVANEAFNQGVPVIATDAVGAAAGGLDRARTHRPGRPRRRRRTPSRRPSGACRTSPRCAPVWAPRRAAPSGRTRTRTGPAAWLGRWPRQAPDAQRTAASVLRPVLRLAVFACMLAVLATAPAALADSTRVKILQECQDGRLTGNYSSREIRDALNNIPDDIDQYSDCRDVLAAPRCSTRPATPAAVAAATAAQAVAAVEAAAAAVRRSRRPRRPIARRLQEATTGGGQPLEISGRRVTPGEGELRNDLPTTLIVVLALLGAAAAAALAPSVRRSARGGLTAIGPKLRRVLPGRSG